MLYINTQPEMFDVWAQHFAHFRLRSRCYQYLVHALVLLAPHIVSLSLNTYADLFDLPGWLPLNAETAAHVELTSSARFFVYGTLLSNTLTGMAGWIALMQLTQLERLQQQQQQQLAVLPVRHHHRMVEQMPAFLRRCCDRRQFVLLLYLMNVLYGWQVIWMLVGKYNYYYILVVASCNLVIAVMLSYMYTTFSQFAALLSTSHMLLTIHVLQIVISVLMGWQWPRPIAGLRPPFFNATGPQQVQFVADDEWEMDVIAA